MEKSKLHEKVAEYLRENSDKHFAASEIAKEIFHRYPKEFEEKKTKSRVINTDKELIQALVGEIASTWAGGRFKRYPQLRRREEDPRKYYWTEKTEEEEVEEAEKSDTHPKTSSQGEGEAGLYDPIRKYLRSELSVYSMRIDEKKKSDKSRNSVSNKWLHPDIVGIENLMHGWRDEIIELAGKTANRKGEKKARFWSLEVKPFLNSSNVREAFFQAVANSSWANFGYLAAETIEGDNTLKELRMLADTHSIGLIQIDRDEPTEKSRILIPARECTDIDLAFCNRLAEANTDFASFTEVVRNFHLTGKTDSRIWEI